MASSVEVENKAQVDGGVVFWSSAEDQQGNFTGRNRVFCGGVAVFASNDAKKQTISGHAIT